MWLTAGKEFCGKVALIGET